MRAVPTGVYIVMHGVMMNGTSGARRRLRKANSNSHSLPLLCFIFLLLFAFLCLKAKFTPFENLTSADHFVSL